MRFKNLDRYKTGGTSQRIKLSIPLPKTPDGRVYRFSPNEAAQPRHFLIGDIKAQYPRPKEKTSRMKLRPGHQSNRLPLQWCDRRRC